MTRTATALAALFLSLPLAAQDDVLQLKNGDIVRGKVLDVDERGIEFQLSPENVIFYRYGLLNPSSAYAIRRRYMDKTSADDHVEVARFCSGLGLTSQGVHHLREAIEVAPARKAELEKEILELRTNAASHLYRKAKAIVDGKSEGEYEAAARALHKILDEYYDTPYGEEARKLEDSLARRIRELTEAKKKEFEAQKKAREAKVRDKRVMEPIEKTEAGFKAVQKDWFTGLEYEGAGSPVRASQVWQNAEQKLLMGRMGLVHARTKTKDKPILARIGTLIAATDKWLIRVYLSLGRVYASEMLDYQNGIRWCNKALKLDPDNDHVFRLKLMITEAVLRARVKPQLPR